MLLNKYHQGTLLVLVVSSVLASDEAFREKFPATNCQSQLHAFKKQPQGSNGNTPEKNFIQISPQEESQTYCGAFAAVASVELPPQVGVTVESVISFFGNLSRSGDEFGYIASSSFNSGLFLSSFLI